MKTNDDQSNTDPHYLSNCHNAPVYVVSSDEGTNSYACSVCRELCGFHAATPRKVTEKNVGNPTDSKIEAIIRDLFFEHTDYREDDTHTCWAIETADLPNLPDKIMSSFATYLEQIVAEQWPEKKRSAYTCQQPDGFNEALDQIAVLWKRVKRQGAYHNKPITYSEFRAIVEGIGDTSPSQPMIHPNAPITPVDDTSECSNVSNVALSDQSVTDLPETYSTDGVAGGMGEEMFTNSFHEWLEDHGVYFFINDKLDSDKEFKCSINLNVLKTAISQLVTQARVDQRAEDNKRLRDLLERLNLEFEVIRCNKCGEPWVSSNPHDIVLEYLAQITNPQEGK